MERYVLLTSRVYAWNVKGVQLEEIKTRREYFSWGKMQRDIKVLHCSSS